RSPRDKAALLGRRVGAKVAALDSSEQRKMPTASQPVFEIYNGRAAHCRRGGSWLSRSGADVNAGCGVRATWGDKGFFAGYRDKPSQIMFRVQRAPRAIGTPNFCEYPPGILFVRSKPMRRACMRHPVRGGVRLSRVSQRTGAAAIGSRA